VGEAEGVASKLAVKVPVCEVMTVFCQLPPEVAVTQAAWADTDKPQMTANAASDLRIRFFAFMDSDRGWKLLTGPSERGVFSNEGSQANEEVFKWGREWLW
jgi:hypothetical protein